MRRYHVANNFGRVLVVTLIVSLLATSAPTAAPALMTIAKQSERIVISTSHDNAILSVLRRWLAYGSAQYWSWTVNNVGAKSTANHEPSASYSPLVISPAPVVIDAPTNLTVTATANTSISLSWTAPSGTVNNYQVERSQSPSGPFPVIGTPTATTFNDTTVSSGNAYLYRVRAVSGGIPSSPSNMAVGTAITYTDNPLSVGVTQIKAVHVSELRQSINAVRSVAGLAAASWLDTSLPGIFVKAVHIQEMRDRLGEALAALSVPVAAYTDPVLATGANGTPVKKIHIEELRQRASGSSSSGSGGAGGDLSVARLDPLNRTGGGGEDPLSRNFNWSIPLVNLPGRAGLSLDLSLTYNSLVWTRSGSSITFDNDGGFPSPGFRLGFPVIQPIYFNSETGKWSYLLITPDGSRVELRQVGSSALYESADSSHMLLDTSTNPMILRTTDSTQFSYELKGSDFQCTRIKDRNGNFITVNYTAFNRIDTVIDTLSRSIKFNYDGSQSLTSITQTWTVNNSPVTHTWASFTYSNPNLTIQTNFPGLTIVGPANGSTIKVLSQVSVNDGSRFTFNYTSWGQIWKISNFAPAPNDQHLRNYRSYNLPQTNSTAHSDCPRFTERRDLAANWNRSGPNGAANLPIGAEQEVLTTYAVPTSATWTMPDNSQQTGMRAQITFPDNTYNKIYFEGTAGTSSGWKRGLPSLVETFDSTNVRQRQLVTTWTQDNTAVSFPLNPRVTETNVHDPAGNRARTAINYQTANHPDGTSCRLPQDVLEYQANATTVLRRMHTEYNLSTTYTSRRIIGLVSEKTLFEVNPNTGAETLMSKVVFGYDETGSIQGNDAPVQHDNTNYTLSFVAGRANLSSVKRYDVTNSSFIVTSTNKYNTAGSVVQATDASNHSVTVSYTDKFAQNGVDLDPALSFTTLAYPTTVTDPDGYTSSARYNYDFGAQTWNQTPMPNTTVNTPGPQQKIIYDSVGRIERVTNLVNNAYRRFIYGPNYVQSFATMNNVADEANTLQVFDGAGRVIAKAGNHPGSVGGFSGQLIQYDIMGRVKKQSNPTETSISISGVIQPYNWTATGDDALEGWLYTEQTYDWKGRSLVTTNPDGTTKEASYGGCGCAGGEVVTLTDEGTLEGGVAKRRQQKIYSDVLGRTIKTEVLNWQGGSVYSAVVNTYNARDQLTLIRQYEGPEGSGTYQDTTITYDGHGRLKTRHIPQQDADKFTSYSYFADDGPESVTDARGATTNYQYTNRHLISSITYSAPTGIMVPATAGFGYDAAGNRLWMTDGLGRSDYEYDQLSRMIGETRTFNDTLPQAPLSNNRYKLSFTYNLAGELSSLTDPFGSVVNYGRNNAGQLTAVTGSSFGGTTMYASNAQYRAWGALKHLEYGNGQQMNKTFDHLKPASFTINGPGQQVIQRQYQYYADGRLRYVQDQLDPKFDRLNEYDHVGRIREARSGAEARGQTESNHQNLPYHFSYTHDAFGHMTGRTGTQWVINNNVTKTFTNDRQDFVLSDADGRPMAGGVSGLEDPWVITDLYQYDAAGLMATIDQWGDPWNEVEDPPARQLQKLESGRDGQGLEIKQTVTNFSEEGQPTVPSFNKYFIRSSVLGGQIVSEAGGDGRKTSTFVHAGGAVLAYQVMRIQASGPDVPEVWWEYRDAGGTAVQLRDQAGVWDSWKITRSVSKMTKAELDPTESDIGWHYSVVLPPPPPPTTGSFGGGFGWPDPEGDPVLPDGTRLTCVVDGHRTPCSNAFAILRGLGPHAVEIKGPGGSFIPGLMPIWTWAPNPPDTGDACVNGICPEQVNVYDTGGDWELDGFYVSEVSGESTEVAEEPQKSDCGRYVDDVLIYHSRVNQQAGKVNIGRGFLSMIPRNQDERERYYQNQAVSGFQNRLIDHQGGWVYAHITGIAGGTLIGHSPIGLWGQTGNDLVKQQMETDRSELDAALEMEKLKFAFYDYYGTLRPLGEVIAERRSEIAGNDAGQKVGLILSSAIDGKMTFQDARNNIFQLLCDH